MIEGVQQKTRLDEAGVIAFLSAQPDIVAAYLFGSFAAERATPRSDVDLAILLADELGPFEFLERRLELMGQLEGFVKGELDVVILNTASPFLQHQVLREGWLLYEGNRRARIEFEVRSGKAYADLQPMREFFHRSLLQEIREGRLGGRE